MSEHTNTVTYPGDKVWGSMMVERLPNIPALAKAAPAMRELIRQSYAWSYEAPNGPLPKGTLDTHYGAQHDMAYLARSISHFKYGSQFWVARSEGLNGVLLGFVKTTPGEALEDPQPDTVYLNDVVVTPNARPGSTISSRQRGYGRTLVHAALKYGGYEDVPLLLEAFEVSEAGPNQLFRNMGLVRTAPAEPFEFPNGAALDMCEYSSPQGLTLSGVVHALEARYEPLGHAYPSKVVIRA